MPTLPLLKETENTKESMEAYVRSTLIPALENHYFQRLNLCESLRRWWQAAHAAQGMDDPVRENEPDEAVYLTPALLGGHRQIAAAYFDKLEEYSMIGEEDKKKKEDVRSEVLDKASQLRASTLRLDGKASEYREAYRAWQDAVPEGRKRTTAESSQLRRLRNSLSAIISAYNRNVVYSENCRELTRDAFRSYPEKFVPTRHYYREAHKGEWPMYFYEYDDVGLEFHIHYDSKGERITSVNIKMSYDITGKKASHAPLVTEYLLRKYPPVLDARQITTLPREEITVPRK